MSTTKMITDAIKDASKAKTKGYDTTATVKRVEGSTVWVHIPGGVDETPVKRTINAGIGDTVQVRVSDGSAWLVGNASAPPTDDTRANSAMVVATDANALAESASKAATKAWGYAEDARSAAATAETHADEAKASAENASEYAARALGNLSTVQNVTETLNWITAHGTMTLTTDVALDPTHVYFVVDPLGDYEVGGTHYSVVTEPDVADIATYYELSIDESLNNYVGTHLALTSEGLWLVPEAGGNKVLIATGGAGHTYEDAGTYILDGNGNVLAQFLASGVQIGQSDKMHTTVGADRQIFYSSDGSTQLVRFGSSSQNGKTNIKEYMTRSVIGLVMYQLAYEADDVNSIVVTDQDGNIITPVVKTKNQIQINTTADVEYYITTYTTAEEIIDYSFSPVDSGYHANFSMSENHGKAYGEDSHAENNATATGRNSHAQGLGVIANGANMFALGKYNDLSWYKSGQGYSSYAVVLGNGTADDARSNALTVDWDGNVDATGSIISDANYEDAWHDSTQGYTVSGVSLAGSTYLGQAIRLEKVSATNKHPIFNGFDISGTGTARIHTLGHYIYKATYNGEQYWYAYIKMRNDNTSAINNFDVTAYIAWI